jgi:hypothetical protein
MSELLKQIERANEQNRRAAASGISRQLELPFAEFEKTQIPNTTLLRQIERANEENRRNVPAAMEQFGKMLNELANGVLPKREPNGFREVSTKDGGRELIPVKL